MLRILDRYVIRQALPPFAIALGVFTFMLMMPPILTVGEQLISEGVAWTILFQAVWFLVPRALALTIPTALLVGLLVTLGRLSEDREWIALQACGVGLARLARPVVGLALLASAATAYVTLVALPGGEDAHRRLIFSVVASRAETLVKSRVFFHDFPGHVLYVREMGPGRAGWDDVFLASTGGGGGPVYLARHADLVVDRVARTVTLVLIDGHSHTVSGDTVTKHEFTSLTLHLDPTTVFPTVAQKKPYEARTIAELRADASEVIRGGFPPIEEVMAIHQKFAVPVACLVFGLIALGLGATNRRSGKMASFVTGIAVVFVYWILMYGAEGVAKAHVLAPWLAPWVANAVLLPASVWLLVRRNRRSDRRVASRLPWLQRSWDRLRRGTTARLAGVGWLPRRRLLDWYVSTLYLRIFALAFGGLLAVFYVSQFIELSEELFRGTATAGALAAYFWYATPQLVSFIIPLAELLATLAVIGLLTRNNELVAMRACGVSLYRAVLPLLAFALAGSAVLFGLQEQLLPEANRRASELRPQLRGEPPQPSVALNRGWLASRDGTAIYHYTTANPDTREMTGLTVYGIDSHTWQLASWWFAERLRCVSGCETTEQEPAQWVARNGWASGGAAGTPALQGPTRFREGRIALEPPAYFATEAPRPEQMTYAELRRYVNELGAGGHDVGPETVWLYRKLAFPFVTLVMTLIAIPFAITTGRHGAMHGIGLGVALAVVYWAMLMGFTWVGSSGLLAPVLAAWAPNLLFTAGAAYLLLTVRT